MLRKTSLYKLIDKICELEAYEEHLENKIKSKKCSFTLDKDKSELYSTRKKLKRYRNLFEGANI